MSRVLAVAVLVIAGVAGFVGYRWWTTPAAAAADAGTRPGFALPDLAGALQSVSQWDGKVLVVNFWATWCEPCREEIPLLDQLQAEYANRGVQFVGIAIDDADEVRRFLEGPIKIHYPVLVGEQEAVDALAGFGAEMTVLPYTAFVGRDGKIAALHAGQIHRDEAIAEIAKLL